MEQACRFCNEPVEGRRTTCTDCSEVYSSYVKRNWYNWFTTDLSYLAIYIGIYFVVVSYFYK